MGPCKEKHYEQCRKTSKQKKQKTLPQHIDVLHSATSPDLFKSALAAFLIKYAHEKDLITYFNKEWVCQNPNWYLGSSKGSPVTNNALESFNRSTKDCHTLRERLPLSRFLVVVLDMVKEWTETYQLTSFSNSPTIELKDWTAGYQWAKSDRKVMVLKADSMKKTYLIASSGAPTVQFGQDWRSFDEYKQIAFAYWSVILPINKDEWQTGECNCPKFFKHYICKHHRTCYQVEICHTTCRSKKHTYRHKAKTRTSNKSKTCPNHTIKIYR